MLSPEPPVTLDPFGCETITVRKRQLQNFEGLISWIREKGYGKTTGLVKLCLHKEDRMDDKCVKSMIKAIKDTCKRKERNEETNKLEFRWNPAAQVAFKISHRDNVYQYVDAGCTDSERSQFVKTACSENTYETVTSNCCDNHLKQSTLDELREHLFSVLAKSSPRSDCIKSTGMHSDQQSGTFKDIAPIIYGAGIPVTKKFDICEGFSLSSLNSSILDLMNERFDGITDPYIYCGSLHSYFPWHIEDGGVYSINYVSKGAPKLWFGIQSKFFGLVDKIAGGLRLDVAHVSCRALLADHKVLIADPEYFKAHHGVPYTTVLQQPGEFVITLPFALHSGFNLGENLAIAANFADTDWIEWGMYAPVCSCNPKQVQFDLTNILQKYRPDLLDHYLHGTSLTFPAGHPREIILLTRQSDQPVSSDTLVVAEREAETSKPRAVKKSYRCKEMRIKDRILFCPTCKHSITGNKMDRMKDHIKNHHPTDMAELLRIVEAKYPPWKPKTVSGSLCRTCGKFIRGSNTHLQKHSSKCHS